MPLMIPSKSEKCKGAMVAAAIGDALGWPNEMRPNNKREGVNSSFIDWHRNSKNPRWHSETIKAGEYSDDTQLTLAVARSIISENWEKALCEKELPYWLEYERGGGGALLRAAACWKEKKLPLWKTSAAKRYYNAGGNGAAMRILPHVIANASAGDVTFLMADIFKDSILTHGHPRAILGAMCYGYALNYLLNKNTVLEFGELVAAVIEGNDEWGQMPLDVFDSDWLNTSEHCDINYIGIWSETSLRMLNQLKYIKQSLGKGLMVIDEEILGELGAYGETKGAGDVAVLSSVYLASKYSNNPQLAITVPAFSCGADTDTIGAMTGGLVGMLSGMGWIPLEWKSVQDFDCLIQMAELLMIDNRIDIAKDFADKKLSKNPSCQWQTSSIGKIRLINSTSATNGKNGFVEIQKWETALGQSIYLKHFVPNTYGHDDNTAKNNDQITLFEEKPWLVNYSDSREPELIARKLILDQNSINMLLGCSFLKKKMTVGKALEVILCILSGSDSDRDISKKYGVAQEMIEIIRKHTKCQ